MQIVTVDFDVYGLHPGKIKLQVARRLVFALRGRRHAGCQRSGGKQSDNIGKAAIGK